MTNCLITGANGFVGSHLVDYLIDNTDWHVFGMVRWRSNLRNLARHLDRIEKQDRLYLVNADLGDEISLRDVVAYARPDYVFHLAAQSFPKTSFSSPIETFDTNVLGTCRLLEILRVQAHDARIHVCASSEMFGRVSRDELPIGENCRFHPASPYAISKVGVDLLGRFYAEAYGMNVQTTRMFTHTGPRRHDVFVESNFAKQIAMIEAGIIPPVVRHGNLDSLRTWADVRDAVRAYYLLLTHDPQPGAFYNIGGEFSCTVGDMLDTLLNMSSISRIQKQLDPSRLRPIDADLQVPDTSKFKKHTGWEPRIWFQYTMLALLNYWRERVANNDAVLRR